ncbi:hypothetical protein [Lachnospira multipara]|uniref:hypothetical protein n=1 Tax=Lachnospira multipara TaxID=28051 RepID=UPI000488C21F|nr:hypothetical protein [Lachnospira multipara]
MTYIKIGRDSYIGYEYKELVVDKSKLSMYIDGMEKFGWVLDDNQVKLVESNTAGKTVVKLKRDRKILNRAELTRLQRNFEDCMKQIESLESSKTSLATAVSLFTGILGCLILAGATMLAVNNSKFMVLAVILSVPGFLGIVMANYIFKRIVQIKTQKINPLIQKKMDEIYEITSKGKNLLE